MDDDEDDPVPIPPVSPKKRHSPFYSKHYTTRTDNSNDPSVATLPVSDSIINESESRAALRDADYDRTTVIFDVVADHNLIDDDEGGDHDDGESVLLPDDAFTASNKEVVHEEEEGLDDDKSLGECDLHVAIYRACGVKALVGAAMERFKVSGKEKTHDSAVTASTTTSAVLDSDLEFAYSAGANTFITLRLVRTLGGSIESIICHKPPSSLSPSFRNRLEIMTMRIKTKRTKKKKSQKMLHYVPRILWLSRLLPSIITLKF